MFEPFLWSHLQNLGFSRDFERRVGQIDGECQQKSQQKKSFCATPQRFALTSD
jgi:hypothetical protein